MSKVSFEFVNDWKTGFFTIIDISLSQLFHKTELYLDIIVLGLGVSINYHKYNPNKYTGYNN
jgi:hypothetical protein